MNWRTGLIYDETREEKRWISPSLRIPMISDTQSEIVGHRSDNYRTVVGA
jgi:hypothetical protein